MTARIVAGVDPGSRVTGYCSLRADGARLELCRMLAIKLHGSLAQRLYQLHDALDELLDQDGAEWVAVEAGSVHRDGAHHQAALICAAARGVALAAAGAHAVDVAEVAVQSARKAVGASAFRQTRQDGNLRVIAAVTRILRLARAPGEDEANAGALAIWAAGQLDWQRAGRRMP